jgi:RNA 3'-terminal phosphate cyclase (ATP)
MDHRSKGVRDSGKCRKHSKAGEHSSAVGKEGADGVDAWSKNSMADFAADQQMLVQKLELESQHRAAATAADATFSDTTGAPADASAPPSAPSPSSASLPASAFREVDGSLLEGGGQVLRNAMAYSALLRQPMRVASIRAARPAGGGLKAQHLKGLQLVEEMCVGQLQDAHIGSRSIEFIPGDGNFSTPQSSSAAASSSAGSADELCFRADTQTAGATGLLLQIALPVAFFLPSPVRLTLLGGTNATMAPVIDYSMHVFAPILRRAFGLQVDFDLVTRGFFPKGGGQVHAVTMPLFGALPAASGLAQRGNVISFSGTALVTHRLPVHIAQHMVDTAVRALRGSDPVYRSCTFDDIKPIVADEDQVPLGDGVSLLLVAHTSTGCVLGASGVGERGLPAETLAQRVAEQLITNLDTGACVDEYMQDQTVIYMALAEGTSVLKTGPLTMHTRTCLYWARFFTGCTIELAQAQSNSTWHTPEPSDTKDTLLIKITGVGYKSRFKKNQ